ncbi:MAG: kinase [Blautia sp.]|nr:kinase [Blautia sp.]
MKKKVKKKKKQQKYIPIKALFGNADDYYVYHMTIPEKLTGGGLGFLAGFLVSMIFFRSILVSLAVGVAMIIPGVRWYQQFLKEKRLKNLLLQFRDMLESLTASYSTGKNTQGAFQDTYADMTGIYGKKSDIVHEIGLIVDGLYNGQNIDVLLKNFADRSHLDDIESFATIFEVSNRYGGNLKKVVADTHQIISDKIETELEIQTLLTANKNELNMMILMPLIIMVTLSGMGNMSIVQNTPVNVVTKIVALAIFGAAYLMGRKIVDIKA